MVAVDADQPDRPTSTLGGPLVEVEYGNGIDMATRRSC